MKKNDQRWRRRAGCAFQTGHVAEQNALRPLAPQTLFMILLAMIVPGNLVAGTGDDDRSERPNIVLIISDDQSWTDYGFMGHPVIQTPCLDRLARQSMTFRRGYVPTSLCRPSLATIITGLYPAQHFITGNDPAILRGKTGRQKEALVADLNSKIRHLNTLPRMLAEKGYVSFQSGKWWEGSFQDGGFTNGMTHGIRNRGGRHGDEGLKIGRKGLQPIFDFIDQAGDRPFFVWYAPFLPHTPHNPPARFLDRYRAEDRPLELAKYYAMCSWFDETCGQLVDHIDQKGLGDNTLILFVADNGWIQRTSKTVVPANWNRNFAPGSKQSPSDGGIRTPIMMRLTGTIRPAMDRQNLVSSVDLAPTILSAAGIAKTKAMTGVNLLDLASGKTVDRDSIFGEIYAHDMADINRPSKSLLFRWCIAGDYKLVLSYKGESGRYGNLHRHLQGDRQPRLFNITSDPFEKSNIFGGHGDVAESLESKINEFFERF